jgi:hypothetical protein
LDKLKEVTQQSIELDWDMGKNISLSVNMDKNLSQCSELHQWLKEMGLTSSTTTSAKMPFKRLHISLSPPGVLEPARQGPRGELYGQESVSHHEKGGVSYNTYVFRERALLVYSGRHQDWHLGVCPDFGHPEHRAKDRRIMGRILSLILMEEGHIGLRARVSLSGPEGHSSFFYLSPETVALGDFVFISPYNRQGLGLDGDDFEIGRFTFICSRSHRPLEQQEIESYMRGEGANSLKLQVMKKEELLSFLASKMGIINPSVRSMGLLRSLCLVSQAFLVKS